MTRWIYRAFLALAAWSLVAGPAQAQIEVPAVLNVYSGDPGAVADRTYTHNGVSFTLTADQVRESVLRGYITGPMQGVLDLTGTAGLTPGAANVPGVVPLLSSADRLPTMPLTRNPGPDGIYGSVDDELIVFIELRKLPKPNTVQKVVNNLQALGLVSRARTTAPADRAWMNESTLDAKQTGNWRLLVYPPRGKGAPPAPSLYFPEAIGALRPSETSPDTVFGDPNTAADPLRPARELFQEFWFRRHDAPFAKDSLIGRITGWEAYFAPVWRTSGTVGQQPEVINGYAPDPFFVAKPEFAATVAGTDGADRTVADDYEDLVGTQFFDPAAAWENRVLDPDGAISDRAADLNSATDFAKRLPPELPDQDATANRPIEILVRADDLAGGADPDADKWALRGINNTQMRRDGASWTAADNADRNLALPAITRADSPNALSEFYPASGQAPGVEVNLLNGQYRLAGTADWKGAAQRREVSAGVGMVELQFEYETAVPVEYSTDAARTEWTRTITGHPNPLANGGPWPFGYDGLINTWDDDPVVATWALDGPDNTRGTDDDQIIPWSALHPERPDAVLPCDTMESTDFTYLRDPLKMQHDSATFAQPMSATNVWKVRRYSGWPYNPAVIGATGNYQGGPLVCRFVVSSVAVVPQDADPASAASPALGAIAQYDPAAGPQLYPQFLTTSNGRHQRPNFLLGYLPDGGTVPSGMDYFWPVSHGARSPSARIWLQTLLNNLVGGSGQFWAEQNGTDPAYLLKGERDVHSGSAASADEDYVGYDFSTQSFTDATERSYARPYWYDIARSRAQAGAQTEIASTHVLAADGDQTTGLPKLDTRPAFDGDDLTPVATAPSVAVGPKRYLGRVFDTPSLIDRVDLTVSGTAAPADWQLQFRDEAGAWTDAGTGFAAVSGSTVQVAAPGPVDAVYGLRVRNENAAELSVVELRAVTLADLRNHVDLPPTVANSGLAPVPASAVRLTGALDRELTATGDNVTPLDLSVDVPRFQPPSRDALERQLQAERGQPVDYVTRVDPNNGWDRYRGSAKVFVDDNRTYVLDADDPSNAPAATTLRARDWDASLYRLAGGSSQFVRWYNEYTGDVPNPASTATEYHEDLSDPANPRYLAALAMGAGGQQHVAVESYAPLDLEFSVAFERRMSLAERFIDFGRSFGGGMSQWVPVTVTNEGNVPLTNVKFYVSAPLRLVQTGDGVSRGRAVALNPIPSQLNANLALGAPNENGLIQVFGGTALDLVPPATPGATAGTRVSTVYLRLGRNDTPSPLRLPVGQPMGNYTGQLRSFVDNLGDGTADVPTDNDNTPNDAKLAVGGNATMKVTIGEGPLARVSDFMDNEQQRNLESADVLNVAPYDLSRTPAGTFQPVPRFEFYSEPNVPDATPSLVVAQDMSQMTADPPNGGDVLSVFYARQVPPTTGGPASWDVWLKGALRPGLPGPVVTDTGYRGFEWPAGAPTNIGAAAAGSRNVYPNVAAVPGTSPAEYLALWHNESEQASGNRRSSALHMVRYSGTTQGAAVALADDSSGNDLVNKAVPRALVDTMNGTAKVAWVAWQNGQGGKATLGFNAIAMPDDPATSSGYGDAIVLPAGEPVMNRTLHTAAGLTNLADPSILASYRDPATNAAPGGPDPRVGNLRAINAFYSAWSPVWQNQDIYYTRYAALQDPDQSTTDEVNTWAEGLAKSPMAEDGYRLTDLAGGPGEVTVEWPTAGNTLTLTSLPGGRVPFPRVDNELLVAQPENSVFASQHPDWVMPETQPRYSFNDPGNGGARVVAPANHKGFADTVLRMSDHDSGGAAVPLVQLRIFPATSLTEAPPDLASNPTLLDVTWDLDQAIWDPTQAEWVLPLTSAGAGDAGDLLAQRGVKAVRIAPGLGRVTFSGPLWRRGQTNPIFVYASYRPATWRLTNDLAGDSQPTASFDWWERLTLVWRRGLENGRGQLWYRTFSLSVPLNRPPLTGPPSAIDDLDTGAPATATVSADDVRDGMIHVPLALAGHRLAVDYEYTTDAGTATMTDEHHFVPGLGPERVVPMDGLGSESMPSIANESFLAGYPLGAGQQTIMSGRQWLAWISTRDLYELGPNPGDAPVRGKAGTHVYLGTFQPDFSPAAEAR